MFVKMGLKKTFLFLGLIILVLTPMFFIGNSYALDEFIDDYDNENNIATKKDIIRNVTLNAMELNYTADLGNWMNVSWSYRKNHTIENATDADINYLVSLTVHYGTDVDSGEDVYLNSKCQTDFDDIRFTDNDGITELDYWMESKVDSDNATFWIEIIDNLSSLNVLIYIYYNNSGVSTTSNGDNTFLIFDDFDGSSINATKWDETKVSGWNTTIADSKLRAWTDGAPASNYLLASTINYDFDTSAEVMAYIDIDNLPSSSIKTLDFQYLDRDVVKEGVGGGWYKEGNYDRRVIKEGSDVWWASSGKGAAIGITRHAISIYAPSILRWSALGIKNFDDGRTDTNLYPDINTRYLRYMLHRNVATDVTIYWVALRNYVYPEPIHGVWGSEEIRVPGYSNTGFFYTVEVLSSFNGSTIVLLTNSTLDGIITVEFSDDNNTWVNHNGVGGSNVLVSGFESIDLRDINYTSLYMRFNFTRGDVELTPRLYQIRVITNDAGVFFNMLVWFVVFPPLILFIALIYRSRGRR